MTLPSSRIIFLIVFLGCCSLIGVAMIFQHVMGLEPCPLCIMQRIAVITTGFIALAGAIHNPRRLGIRIYGVLVTLAALGGAGISIRHLWLQHLPPDQVPACGPSLDYLLEVFPLTKVLSMLLVGDGTCAQIVWTLFGISIPGWTLVAFVGLAGIGIFQLVRPALAPGRA